MLQLKAILESKHMTITDCAKLSGISYYTLRKWAAGEREPSNAKWLKMLADALGLESIDYLYLDPHQIKIEQAVRRSNIHKGVTTTSAVLGYVPSSISDKLTADEYALLLNCINKAYHDGKSSAGAEMVDSNAVWINSLQAVIEWDKNEHLKISRA